jgi:hypothetical protein
MLIGSAFIELGSVVLGCWSEPILPKHLIFKLVYGVGLVATSFIAPSLGTFGVPRSRFIEIPSVFRKYSEAKHGIAIASFGSFGEPKSGFIEIPSVFRKYSEVIHGITIPSFGSFGVPRSGFIEIPSLFWKVP